MMEEIYDFIMENGELSSKQDILDEDNNVYTKKIPVDIRINNAQIRMISVSGYESDLSDTSATDVRLCVNNYRNDYLNLFVVSASDLTLGTILRFLKEKKYGKGINEEGETSCISA